MHSQYHRCISEFGVGILLDYGERLDWWSLRRKLWSCELSYLLWPMEKLDRMQLTRRIVNRYRALLMAPSHDLLPTPLNRSFFECCILFVWPAPGCRTEMFESSRIYRWVMKLRWRYKLADHRSRMHASQLMDLYLKFLVRSVRALSLSLIEAFDTRRLGTADNNLRLVVHRQF